MLTLFDWLVLLSVVGVIAVWLWRHLRKVFSASVRVPVAPTAMAATGVERQNKVLSESLFYITSF